jgi:hypothetical protein
VVLVLGVAPPETEQARHHRKVVLDSVVNFAESDFLFFQGCSDPILPSPAFGEVYDYPQPSHFSPYRHEPHAQLSREPGAIFSKGGKFQLAGSSLATFPVCSTLTHEGSAFGASPR